MKSTARLLQHTARITLFTRKNCGLCDVAKSVLNNVGKTRSFEYNEIDVMAPGEGEWKNAYEFDVPVVHVQRIFHTYSKPDIATEARKLMHHFDEGQVEELIEEAEGHS
ncbi:hypothetical protein JMJ35_008031 [Cladonia borealis]|uniref:Glutaredoxin-like protein n=1 Tax=Cladonia borealis TaxID=184061 RepID=A0AA39UZE3_9LECA|nr:hypothetical protein JMJ35_008031 [Cladonia borealis]